MFSFLSKFPFLLNLITTLFPSAKRLRSDTSSFNKAHEQTASASEKSKQLNKEQLNGEVASELHQDLQREIRQGRKFSLAEAIGREGGSFMKGESAIPRPVRAANAIKQYLNSQLVDPSSAFATTLFTWVTADIRVSRQLDTPLVALEQILESLLNESTTFYEFSRQVAIAQSHITGNRPHFQQPGRPPLPHADYTHESIKELMSELLQPLTTTSQETE